MHLQQVIRQLILNPKSKLRKYYLFLGIGIVVFSLTLLGLIFYPIVASEIRFWLKKGRQKQVVLNVAQIPEDKNNTDYLVPVDINFGIVIPKIEANAKIIADVDPENPAVYQKALTEGVAQAAGSANPDEPGNLFLFSHSGRDLLEAGRYNAVFYLLSKLEKGDEIDIFYQGKKFVYVVSVKKIVNPEETSFLDNPPDLTRKNLILMTCWPGGTTWKRLIVEAIQK